ncbi:MAG: hypothetical protein AB8B55_02005 [Mariniblastus sp.]
MSFMETETYQFKQTGDGAVYRLPSRDTSKFKTVGLFLIAAGLFGCMFMLSWISFPVVQGIGMLLQGNLVGLMLILFGSFGLFGLLQTSRMLAAGIAILKNDLSCEIELKGNRLFCTERFAWASFKRKTLISNISRLEIVSLPTSKENGQPDFMSDFKTGFENLALIHAIGKEPEVKENSLSGIFGKSSNSFRFALGYEDSFLRPLAEDLALRLNKLYEPTYDSNGIKGPVSKLVTTSVASETPPTPREQPTHSKIEIVREGKSVAYSVPPAGIKGTHGLYWFSIVWLTFTGVVSIVFFSLGIFGDEGLLEKGGIWAVLGLLAFMMIFVGVGIGMFVGSLNMAKRTVMLGVNKGMLFIERKSIFRTNWIEFERNKIAAIQIGPSGMAVNDVPVLELQIIDTDGNKQGLLSQLDETEISWLANELSEGLGLPKSSGENFLFDNVALAKSQTAWPQPPEGILELVELTPKCRAISVPRSGISSQIRGFIVGFLLMLLGVGVLAGVIHWGGEITNGIVAVSILGLLGLATWIFYLSQALISYDIVALSDSKNDAIGVLKKGLFGKTQYNFPRESNPKITIEKTLSQSSNRVLFCLKLKNSSTKVSLMSGRPLVELRYVTAHLRDWVAEGQIELQPEPEFASTQH